MEQERREYQRLALTRPLAGTFGGVPIQLLEVSATGALIDGQAEIPVGTQATARFTWRGHRLEIEAEAIRTEEGRAGLLFTAASEVLHNLISDSALAVLRAQHANLEGDRKRNLVFGDETLTTSAAALVGGGFVTWTLRDGTWKRRKSLLPDQPENGFTLSESEPEDQVALLRQTWEEGDDEARRLTRLFAELSVAAARTAP